MITQERLKEVLRYCEETGDFYWKISIGRVKHGSLAGHIHKNKYKYIKIDNNEYLSHRLAWLYIYGNFPNGELDHINRIKSDNRIINLRDVTNTENSHNRINSNSNNKTGFLGVSIIGNTYRADIRVNKTLKYLGCFETPELAHKAYIRAKRELHQGMIK